MRERRIVTRFELLTMIHVVGVIGWLGAGIGLLVLHWVALRVPDYAGLATVIGQSRTLGTWLFAPASLVTLVSGVALVATEPSLHFTDLWILIGFGGFVASLVVQMTVADRARGRFLTTVTDDGADDPRRLAAAARRVTYVNTFDIAVLLAVVGAMFARPSL
jgi:uncharacterized membrane protein